MIYKVIIGTSVEDLETKVNELLTKGSTLIGGMVILTTYYNEAQIENHNLPYDRFDEFCQAMMV